MNGGADATGARLAVEADVLCLRCGYNLRGLDIAGTCPECGCPVADSMHFPFSAADAQWLASVRDGAVWLWWCLLLIALAPAWIFLVAGFLQSPGGVLGLLVLLQLASIGGVFLLTARPSPATHWTEGVAASRRLARWLAVASLAVTVVTSAALSPGDETVALALDLLCLSAAAAVVLVVVHLHRAMRWGGYERRLRYRLAAVGLSVMWLGAASTALGVHSGVVPLDWRLPLLFGRLIAAVVATGWAASILSHARTVFANAHDAAPGSDGDARRGEIVPV